MTAHPKKKGSETLDSLIGSALKTASVAEELVHQIQPTSSLEELVVTTPQRTSLAGVENVTPYSTVSEFESSLEDLDTESTESDDAVASLIFDALFKNVQIGEEGGYQLVFEVPDSDRDFVGELMKLPRKMLSLVVIGKPKGEF